MSRVMMPDRTIVRVSMSGADFDRLQAAAAAAALNLSDYMRSAAIRQARAEQVGITQERITGIMQELLSVATAPEPKP